MSGDVVRLTAHPNDREVVLVHVPVALNDIATQLPANLDRDLRALVMHNTAIPALYRWARHHEIHVTDNRATEREHRPRTLPVECAHCAQPARLYDQPTICPACGEQWKPVTPPADALALAPTNNCPTCSRPQRGRFPFCSDCGAPMAHGPATTNPLIAQQERPHLDEPLPLAQTIEETEELAPPR